MRILNAIFILILGFSAIVLILTAFASWMTAGPDRLNWTIAAALSVAVFLQVTKKGHE